MIKTIISELVAVPLLSPLENVKSLKDGLSYYKEADKFCCKIFGYSFKNFQSRSLRNLLLSAKFSNRMKPVYYTLNTFDKDGDLIFNSEECCKVWEYDDDNKGSIIGTFIISDTPDGRILRELLDSKIELTFYARIKFYDYYVVPEISSFGIGLELIQH